MIGGSRALNEMASTDFNHFIRGTAQIINISLFGTKRK
jgi:hypothetical protein